MMTRFFSALLCIITSTCFLASAQNFQRTSAGVKTKFGLSEIEIRFYSPAIVRILKSPGAGMIEKESLSVIKVPKKTTFTVKLEGDELQLSTRELLVVFNQKMVSFLTKR